MKRLVYLSGNSSLSLFLEEWRGEHLLSTFSPISLSIFGSVCALLTVDGLAHNTHARGAVMVFSWGLLRYRHATVALFSTAGKRSISSLPATPPLPSFSSLLASRCTEGWVTAIAHCCASLLERAQRFVAH